MKPKDVIRRALDTPTVTKVVLSKNRVWSETLPNDICIEWSLRVELEGSEKNFQINGVHLYQIDNDLKVYQQKLTTLKGSA